MRIDLEILRESVVTYIHQPEAREELATNANSMLANIFALLCFSVIGLFLICTIVLARFGWELASESVLAIVKGSAFEDPIKTVQKKIEESYICIASPVMIGPEGFGLLLFSESKQAAQQPQYLAKKAKSFLQFYSGERSTDRDDGMQLIELLSDDTFVPNRRRMVPDAHSDGQRLVLLDCEIKPEYVAQDDSGRQLVLCAYIDITHGESNRPQGRVIYLPWKLANPAIKN